MDTAPREHFEQNNLQFQKALDRIIKKCARVQHEEDAMEVDLKNTNINTVVRWMKIAKTSMKKQQAKEDPNSDEGLDDTDDEMSMYDRSTSLLSDLEMNIQPESEDQELEMTLNRQNCSLAEVYSSAVNHIGQAQRLHCVSKAADSVVQKYRKWRLQASGSMNSTSNVSFRHKRQEHEATTTGQGTSVSAFRGPYLEDEGKELAHHSPQKPYQVQQHTPKQARDSPKGSLDKTIFIMDLSELTHLPTNTSGIQLNETVTLSDVQSSYEPSLYCPASPSQGHSPRAKASPDLSLQSKRLLLAMQQQTYTKGPMYAPEFNVDEEKCDVNGSPLRQSLLKARLSRDIRRSPYAFPKTLNIDSPRACSSLNSSSPQFSPSHRALDTQQLSQSHLRSKVRRHLPFDSSLHTKSSSYSLKSLDDYFTDAYHKFICLNKSSPFSGAPCQKCAQKSDAPRHHSSTALAALISPHRVLLKKRFRDVDLESPPQSKRYRGSSYMHSPGSMRHGREMLRRRLDAESRVPAGAPEFNVDEEKCDVNGSPLRQSLLKARLRSRDNRRSPYAFPKTLNIESPRACSSLSSSSPQCSPSHRVTSACWGLPKLEQRCTCCQFCHRFF